MIDQFRRPMRIFPRNTRLEEERRNRETFDRIGERIEAEERNRYSIVGEEEADAIYSYKDIHGGTPPALPWWKRLFGKVG